MMILDLYTEKGLIFQTLATGFKVSHINNFFKFDVVETENVGAKFKNAVKEQYNAKFLNDSDIIIRFAIKNVESNTEEKTEETSEKNETNADEINAETKEKTKADTNESSKGGTSIDDIKKSIVDTVKRCLFVSVEDKVDLHDLENYLDNFTISFIKVSLKN